MVKLLCMGVVTMPSMAEKSDFQQRLASRDTFYQAGKVYEKACESANSNCILVSLRSSGRRLCGQTCSQK